ncbi:MAG TPA: hypothetical protein HA263_07980 [Methanoregulaceae archaeon]|nr:hypothetical protein [Methanoregulaceae archaeon]
MSGLSPAGFRSWGLRPSLGPLDADLALVPGASALYLFDEGAGTVLTDYSGNGNHGTLGAAASAPTWGPLGLTFASSQYVSLPQFTFAGAFSAIWVAERPSTATGFDFVLADANDATNKLGYNTGAAALMIRVGNTTNTTLAQPSGYHSVAVTRSDTGGVSAGGNGALSALFTDADAAAFDRVGYEGSNGLAATVAALLLYSFELTARQAAQSHAALRSIVAPRGIVLP